MTDGRAIIDRWFDSRDGLLLVDGVPVTEIAERFGTPSFVYSRAVLDKKLAMLRTALPSEFDVYYSIKANPSQGLLRVFLEHGCGLEIASAGEMYQAIQAGGDPHRIVFAGPGKTDAELEMAVGEGIGEVHAESLEEIDRLADVAERSGRIACVAVRVNPGADARGGAMQMGGKASPFGVDEEHLDSALDRIERYPALAFGGIHIFSGTQILDHEVLLRQYSKAFEIGRRASVRTGRPLPTLDFGGGLGIPYFPNEHELEIDRFGEKLGVLFEKERVRAEFRGTRFMVEPGRYLVGECGVYLTRITTVKESRGKKFYVTDGGMHHHLAASGNLGQVIKRNFPSAIVTALGTAPSERVDVVGPLCTPLDVLARDVELPEVDSGQLFAVFQSGAYARAASPHGFLSHPTPPEVIVCRGRATLIRRRGEVCDYLADQTDPATTRPGGDRADSGLVEP